MGLRDDFLIRQVSSIAEAVLRAVLGRSEAPTQVVDACRSQVGLDPDLAAGLPPDGLVALLTNQEGFDAARGQILGLGLAARAFEVEDGARFARAAARLLDAASIGQPAEAVVAQVRAELRDSFGV